MVLLFGEAHPPIQLLMICTPRELARSMARSAPKLACSSVRPNLPADPPRDGLEEEGENLEKMPSRSQKAVTARLGTALLISCHPRRCILQGKSEETTFRKVIVPCRTFLSLSTELNSKNHRRSHCRCPIHLHIPRRSQQVHRKVPRARRYQ